MAQAEQTGKPKEVLEKMVEGKLKKFAAEMSLLNQAYIKDANINIKQLLQQNQAQVLRFTRLVMGEGIEKQQTDFVKEVMEQARK